MNHLCTGADIKAKDADGFTAVLLCKKLGQTVCEKHLIQYAYNLRAKSSQISQHSMFAHQYFVSSMKTYFRGVYAQRYFAYTCGVGKRHRRHSICRDRPCFCD